MPKKWGKVNVHKCKEEKTDAKDECRNAPTWKGSCHNSGRIMIMIISSSGQATRCKEVRGHVDFVPCNTEYDNSMYII